MHIGLATAQSSFKQPERLTTLLCQWSTNLFDTGVSRHALPTPHVMFTACVYWGNVRQSALVAPFHCAVHQMTPSVACDSGANGPQCSESRQMEVDLAQISTTRRKVVLCHTPLRPVTSWSLSNRRLVSWLCSLSIHVPTPLRLVQVEALIELQQLTIAAKTLQNTCRELSTTGLEEDLRCMVALLPVQWHAQVLLFLANHELHPHSGGLYPNSSRSTISVN